MEESSTEQALEASRAIAARLGAAEWHLEIEPEVLAEAEPEASEEAPPAVPASLPKRLKLPPRLLPSEVPESETPPPPERILEALLFVGGTPLTLQAAVSVLRGFGPEQVQTLIEQLNAEYRRQNRPYHIVAKEPGFQLVERPSYQGLKERLYGGPREARLGQTALDVLSLVAYRQPISKVELDTLRGSDSAAVLRQLVRLGLLATSRDEKSERQISYHTTSRFLELFGLSSLEELPRLGETLR